MKSVLKISYPDSKKVYLSGTIHPDVKVGMRKVSQTPTVTVKDGVRMENPNPDVYIYDTSGPYGDEKIEIDLNNGLPHVRGNWIRARKENDAMNIGQMYDAKKGIITPEM